MIMTDNQLQYNFNAKRSRGLCAEMERLMEFADYMDKLFNYDSREVAITRVLEIKIELDQLWDIQIKLFYEIQDEFKEGQRTAVMDKMSLPSRRSANNPSSKHY